MVVKLTDNPEYHELTVRKKLLKMKYHNIKTEKDKKEYYDELFEIEKRINELRDEYRKEICKEKGLIK